MSTVAVTDKRGGVFQVVVNFTYGECDRLPYNQLRKVKAKIEQVPHGGIKAIADFNIRETKQSRQFVDVLDLFGEDGSFVHGSGADPEVLSQAEPPGDDEDEESDSLPAAASTAGTASTTSAAPSPAPARPAPVPAAPPPEDDEDAEPELEVDEDAAPPDLEEESEADLEVDESASGSRAGDKAVESALCVNENREQTLARVAEAAGESYGEDRVRRHLLRLLQNRFRDADYVAAWMKRQGWPDVSTEEVEAAVQEE